MKAPALSELEKVVHRLARCRHCDRGLDQLHVEATRSPDSDITTIVAVGECHGRRDARRLELGGRWWAAGPGPAIEEMSEAFGGWFSRGDRTL